MCLMFLHQDSELALSLSTLRGQARLSHFQLLAKRSYVPGLVHCVVHVVLPTVFYLVSFSFVEAPLPCGQGAVAPIFVCTVPSTGDVSQVVPFSAPDQHILDIGSLCITLTYLWCELDELISAMQASSFMCPVFADRRGPQVVVSHLPSTNCSHCSGWRTVVVLFFPSVSTVVLFATLEAGTLCMKLCVWLTTVVGALFVRTLCVCLPYLWNCSCLRCCTQLLNCAFFCFPATPSVSGYCLRFSVRETLGNTNL